MLSKKLAAVDKTRCVACGCVKMSLGGCQGAPGLLRRRGGGTLRRLRVRKLCPVGCIEVK